MAEEVGDLYAALGLRVNKAQFSEAMRLLGGAKKSTDELHGAFQDKSGKWRAANGRFLTTAEKAKLGLKNAGDAAKKAEGDFMGLGRAMKWAAAYFGLRQAAKSLIGFNMNVEDAKLGIAGMLALARKTGVNEQLAETEQLYANIQRRANELPGTTEEYVNMLGNITQPVIDAGLSLKQLEDLTVRATVAAKALNVPLDVAARDVDQALMGQFHAVDRLTGKLLGSIGYKGEKGRKKYNALSQKDRAKELDRAFSQKAVDELAVLQGKTLSGRLSTVLDTVNQFFGRIGKGLFERLGGALERVTKWFDKNREKINAFADAIAETLGGAFDEIAGVIEWFTDGSDLAIIALGLLAGAFTVMGLAAAKAWFMALGPLGKIITLAALLIPILRRINFIELWQKIQSVGERIKTFFTEDIPNAVTDAVNRAVAAIFSMLDRLRNNSLFRGILNVVGAGGALKVADAAAADATAATAPSRALARSGGTVNAGGVTFQINGSKDPHAVASEMKKMLDDHWGNLMHQTQEDIS